METGFRVAARPHLYLSEHRRRDVAGGASIGRFPHERDDALDTFLPRIARLARHDACRVFHVHDIYGEAKVSASYPIIADEKGRTLNARCGAQS
jgi:hypothetical protein